MLFIKFPKVEAVRSLSPVTPRRQYSSKKEKQEGHVRDPHDDSHGVDTKDGPRWDRRRWDRSGSTDVTAVLTGAGS